MKECTLCGSRNVKWSDGDRHLCEIHVKAYEIEFDDPGFEDL